MRHDPLWHIHKNDPDWPYDEYGFAKDIPKEERRKIEDFFSFVDLVVGNVKEVEILEDYTSEFIKISGFEHQCSVNSSWDQSSGDLKMTFTFSSKHGKFSYPFTIAKIMTQDEEEFRKCRNLVYRQMMHTLRNLPFDPLFGTS